MAPRGATDGQPAPPAQCSDYLFRGLRMCTVVCTLVRLGWVRPSAPPLESWTDPRPPSQNRSLEQGQGAWGAQGGLGGGAERWGCHPAVGRGGGR